MAVSVDSYFRGTPQYHPTRDHDTVQRPFRSRRRVNSRIRIQPLTAHHLEYSLHYDRASASFSSSASSSSTSSSCPPSPSSLQIKFTDKLAVSRESAKRFVRSLIAQNSNDTQQTTGNDKRRLSIPARRSNSCVEGVGVIPSINMRGASRAQANGPAAAHRPRLSSDMRSSTPNAFATNSPTMNQNKVVLPSNMDDERPVAAGNGVSVSINMTEPCLFLQGFDISETATGNTAMLRGSLHVRVQKSAKIKAITLKFKGRSVTKWPEGIPPRKVEFEETNTLMNHVWPFFNAQFDSAESSTGADAVHLLKPSEPVSSISRTDTQISPNSSTLNLSSKEVKRLSLQANKSRSFNKEDVKVGPSVATKGYRTFHPGDYYYNFELPIDSRLPETIDVELGNVKYELEATIERSGAFRANLAGTKEVLMIRAPAEGSLEQVEPIAISRNWEDQLHYDIVISGKSFPLGSQVPIAFKLTPLAKVQCHRIKVLITENIEYFCSNKRVHRMEPPRKVQLFEKRSDSDPTSAFPGSTMRITAGGGIPYDARARAARGESVVPADTTNLLGALDVDTSIGPTEMEFNVQLPSCHTMKERDRLQRLHFDTTYTNIQVHHWIKIVMRLSKPDAADPTKRRHFEISIDSPFHILSCRATQNNISLPAYSGAQQNGSSHLYDCGCPGAAKRRNSPVTMMPSTTEAEPEAATSTTATNNEPHLARPPMAHIGGAGQYALGRPIHLLRAPSYNPPAFDAEQPPPAMITPPPQYDTIASPTSGLADYFARLSDAYDEDDDAAHRDGRVNIPLTPGARVNRSMDLGRAWVAVGE